MGESNGFVHSTGTGGTLASVGKYLKEISNNKCKIWLADPPGSILNAYFNSEGKLMKRTGSSITEGIGQGRITKNLQVSEKLIDKAILIKDEDSIKILYELLAYDGFFVDASSALNIASSIKMGIELPEGSTVVTILRDAACRYQPKLFSKK